MNDDFYIGYRPSMPPASARFVRVFVAVCAAALVGAVAVLWAAQQPFAAAFFEFGTVRSFEGTIRVGAVPFIIVENPEQAGALPAFERLALVAPGKHGFDAAPFDGRRVRLDGTLIYRDGLRMIEVAAPPTPVAAPASPAAAEEPAAPLGRLTLRGEIVDSKCYLGVMNPGSAKPHRDCAALCLRGGVPPLFIVRDRAGRTSELWLVSETGRPVNLELLEYVAEPVEIEGDAERLGDQLFFRIDPRRIVRLD